MSRLSSKFINPEVIVELKTRKDFNLDISSGNQLDDKDLGIGILTTSLIEQLLEGGSISENQIDIFFDAVRAYYIRAYEYSVKWLRLDDEFVKHCVFVDFARQTEIPFSYVEKVLKHFCHIRRVVSEDPNIVQLLSDGQLGYQSIETLFSYTSCCF